MIARRIALLLALCLGVLAGAAARAEPADIAAAGRGVVRVVLVSSDGENVEYVGHGSGFAVAPTLIVTNAHVVAPARDNDTMIIGVVPSEGASGYQAELIAISPGNDLALLRLVDKGAIPALALFPGAVADGAEVYAIGYPGNVDLAQGLSLAEIIEPQAAVKTRGYVSAGRSSRQFETLLHTAAIGIGNSGGPLLDGCGRVIGVNSFGTLSQGADSEFYFAVSIRELLGFLRQAEVTPRISGIPCRSLAELDRQELERAAGERARADAESRRRAGAAEQERVRTLHRAELQVLSERENGMALAGLLLLLTLAAGGAAAVLEQRGQRRFALIAGGAGVLMLLGALAAWFTRPPLAAIDERASGAAIESDTAPAPAAFESTAGALVCIFDAARSRATVSDAADVLLEWRKDGCMNRRSQYGLAENGWSRILVPNDEATVSVNSFDPESRIYKVERFLLDLSRMNEARAARARYAAPACGGGEAAARRLGQDQAAIRALLPASPNERLLYRCERR